MTEAQRTALTGLAGKVMQGFKHLTVFETIHRIMNISNRSVGDAMKGFLLMRGEKIIPDGFCSEDGETERKLVKMFDSPVMHELITRLGLAVEKIRVDPNAKQIVNRVDQVDAVRTPAEMTGSEFDRRRREFMAKNETHTVESMVEKIISVAPPEEKGPRPRLWKRLALGNDF